jgi:hypothetical protein
MWRGRPRPRDLSLGNTASLLGLGIHNPPMVIRHRWKLRTWLCCRQLAGVAPALLNHMSSTPLAKYRYRRRLPHLQRADAHLFVTFCTARLSLPGTARDLVLEHCLREGGILPLAGGGARATQARIRLYAVVIMPDHVHLLLSPLRDLEGWPFPLVDILQCLKSATAHD